MRFISSSVAAALAVLHFAPSFGFTMPQRHSRATSKFPNQVATARKNSNRQRFTSRAPPALSSTESPYLDPKIDVEALAKYTAAGITELTLFGLSFQTVDLLLSRFSLSASGLPTPLLFVLFYGCSLKSRIFNPLNNQRPNRSKAIDGKGSSGFRDRAMPSWTPPGVVFPIMWLLIIGPIRAYSSSVVAKSVGSLFSLPIMAFVLHLTIGDVWNTINNTEKRYGASVIGVLFVVLSAANAANQYYSVLPLAGKLLGATLLWLVTAATLIADTWRLNPVSVGGETRRVPLFPVKGEAETSFMWFGGGGDGIESEESAGGGAGCVRKVEDGDEEEKVTYQNREQLLKALSGGNK
jgi:tryptophan-rich sensory protein